MIALCLHVNPRDRPGLKELLQCPALDHEANESLDTAKSWLNDAMKHAEIEEADAWSGKGTASTQADRDKIGLATTRNPKLDRSKTVSFAHKEKEMTVNFEDRESNQWTNTVKRKDVVDLSENWASQAVGAKVVELEKHLRVICAYIFQYEEGLGAEQSKQFLSIIREVGDVLVDHASAAAFEAVARAHVLHYIAFAALRTRDKSPECLDAFWTLLQTVLVGSANS